RRSTPDPAWREDGSIVLYLGKHSGGRAFFPCRRSGRGCRRNDRRTRHLASSLNIIVVIGVSPFGAQPGASCPTVVVVRILRGSCRPAAVGGGGCERTTHHEACVVFLTGIGCRGGLVDLVRAGAGPPRDRDRGHRSDEVQRHHD